MTETYITPVENHNPMEPHATLAVWEGDQLTVYDATQGIFGDRKVLAKTFGLPLENVRVVSHFLGGGFGCKGSTWSHVVIAALAAKQVGRPVKLVLERRQMFGPVGYRPRTEQNAAGSARQATATLTDVGHDVHSQTSTFDEFVEPSAAATRILYDSPNCRNLAPPGPAGCRNADLHARAGRSRRGRSPWNRRWMSWPTP